MGPWGVCCFVEWLGGDDVEFWVGGVGAVDERSGEFACYCGCAALFHGSAVFAEDAVCVVDA